jgi:undecaprenyl-diphosphatase
VRRSEIARWRMICLVSLALFLGLGIAVYASGILPGDVLVRQFLLQSDGGAVRRLARWANYGGRVHVLLPAAVLVFWLSSVARRNWQVWCAVLIGSSLIQHLFKFLVGRSRPSGSSLGFPSGHTTAAATFAVVLIYIASRERLSRAQRLMLDTLGVGLMLVVGWARIMRHAHWPSDVLGGFLLGIGCAAAAAWWASSHAEAAPESHRVGDPETPRLVMPTTSRS